jgi:Tfp pilus assembly protein PilZ
MFIDDPQPLPRDAEIDVRFRPARHLPYMQAKARVIYVQPEKGSGVQFTEIGPEQRQLILRLIHHKTANRRESPRVPLATQIHIQELMALAYSRDVSIGGMFVETTVPCEIGTRMDLRFHLNDGGPVVVTAGEVRYIVPKMGMGVLFVGLAKDDRKRIENLVAKSDTLVPETPSTAPAS